MLFLCRANLIQLKKIKVGAVTYLNTKPLIYGMQQEEFLKDYELIRAYPSQLAEMLKKGELDIALVPVALLPELPEYHIVSNFCIASDHEVASVCLFSEKPLSEIRRVYLDYQSKTSVALLKILFRRHWKQDVEWLNAEDESYMDQIKEDTAGLIIGDRALQFYDRYAYRYDLVSAWREMTGMPFVFAVWVSIQPLPDSVSTYVDSIQEKGCGIIHNLAASESFPFFNVRQYFTHHIHYHFDDAKKEAMYMFLDMIKKNDSP
jgi:chorismate dehydratase